MNRRELMHPDSPHLRGTHLGDLFLMSVAHKQNARVRSNQHCPDGERDDPATPNRKEATMEDPTPPDHLSSTD